MYQYSCPIPEAGAISELQKARVRVIGGRLAGTPAGLCPPMMPICVSGSVLTNGAGTLILISLHLAMNVFSHWIHFRLQADLCWVVNLALASSSVWASRDWMWMNPAVNNILLETGPTQHMQISPENPLTANKKCTLISKLCTEDFCCKIWRVFFCIHLCCINMIPVFSW